MNSKDMSCLFKKHLFHIYIYGKMSGDPQNSDHIYMLLNYLYIHAVYY